MARATVAKTTQKQGQQAETSSSVEQAKRSLSPDPYGEVLALQEMVGNGAVNRLLRGGRSAVVQAKLMVSQPEDKYEQEADRVAEEVVRRINTPPTDDIRSQHLAMGENNYLCRKPTLQNPVSSLQPASAGDGLAISPNLESAIQHARSGGHALPAQVREPMEQAFGADFSRVRMHIGFESERLGRLLSAQAFTTEQDIFFGQGAYKPESQVGQKLLAHELTHVMQQSILNPCYNYSFQKEKGIEVRSSVTQQSGSQSPFIKHFFKRTDGYKLSPLVSQFSVLQRKVTHSAEGFIGGPEGFLEGGPRLNRYLFTRRGGWIDRYHLEEHIRKANQVMARLEAREPEFSVPNLSNPEFVTDYSIDYSQIPEPIDQDKLEELALLIVYHHDMQFEVYQAGNLPDLLAETPFAYEDLPSNRIGTEIGLRYRQQARERTMNPDEIDDILFIGRSDPRSD
jgi:hypothetical protein